MGLINARDIKVARCHRKQMLRHVYDRNTQLAKPRPVIMKLHYYPDRECIWKARGSLKGSQYWLSEDFPQEIVKRRQILNSIRRKVVQEGKKASVSVDRLCIEGQIYTIDTLNNLPESLQLAEVSTKRSTLYTAFFSQHSPLSNIHLARFVNDGIQYENNEHYYQHKRAIENADQEEAKEILQAKQTLLCYKLGQNVSTQNPADWENRCLEVMY